MEVIDNREIRLLPDQVINQIAAGEVIESPASVVKELVENALDAGATRIAVEIKGGGLQLIRVIDDGSGMSRDDALLSLERHATSKLSTVDDLFTLGTMGFRGEALASIAAISELTLLTARDEGTRVEVKGGKLLHSASCARPQGTTVEVRALFYNVPARKRFQKSAAVCGGEILRMVTALSLAHPEVGFELIQQGEALLSAEPAELIGRVGQVLGSAFAEALLPIGLKEERLEIRGYVGRAQENRRNRGGQHLFINGRSVVCLPLSFAVRDGYSTALPEGRHPLFVLHLTLDPGLVDVNVHPQKREVRIREESWLQKQIRRAVADALQEKKGESAEVSPPYAFRPPPLSAPFEAQLLFQEEEESAPPELPIDWGFRPIGVFAHFLLVEEGGKLVVVDLSAASAQIAFESLVGPSETVQQALLIPLSFELSSSEALLVQRHLPSIEEMGIAIRPLGRSAFIVDAHPPHIDAGCLQEVVLALVDELERGGDAETLKERLARRVSYYPRRRNFSFGEAQEIYKELLKTRFPDSTPQGRPTKIGWKREELAALIKGRGKSR